MPCKTRTLFYALALFSACWAGLPASAQAHYLWVLVEPQPNDKSTVHVYFEESPRPGDGHYLDPFIQRGKTWTRTLDAPKASRVEMAETKKEKFRWLTGSVPGGGPRAIDSFGTFGVYRYGQTDVLLHYYAKFLDVSGHEQLHELARADQQRLDIVPHDDQERMELTVYWQGKPRAGLQVFVRGPKGFRRTVKTDGSGKASFEPVEAGRYTMRTHVELPDESGEMDGKTYEKVRHHATLTMRLPLKD